MNKTVTMDMSEYKELEEIRAKYLKVNDILEKAGKQYERFEEERVALIEPSGITVETVNVMNKNVAEEVLSTFFAEKVAIK